MLVAWHAIVHALRGMRVSLRLPAAFDSPYAEALETDLLLYRLYSRVPPNTSRTRPELRKPKAAARRLRGRKPCDVRINSSRYGRVRDHWACP